MFSALLENTGQTENMSVFAQGTLALSTGFPPSRQSFGPCQSIYGGTIMSPVIYSLFSYGLTAVISYIVIAIIVAINAVMSASDRKKTARVKKKEV